MLIFEVISKQLCLSILNVFNYGCEISRNELQKKKKMFVLMVYKHYLRFWYSHLKQLLLKAYVYLDKVFGFSVYIWYANWLINYENQVSSYISAWRCGFGSVKLAHQKSKPVMLLSQVKLAGNVCHRLCID